MNDVEKKNRVPEKQGVLKNYLVIIASMIVVLAGIHVARAVLGPMFLATFFTVLLIIPVNWLKAKGFPSWASLAIVVLCVALAGLGTITVVGSQLAQFAGNIPQYRDQFVESLKNYNLDLSDVVPFLKSDKDKAKEQEKEKTEPKVEETKEAYLNELRWRDEYEQSKRAAKTVRADEKNAEPLDSEEIQGNDGPEEERTQPVVAPVSASTADYYAAGDEVARMTPIKDAVNVAAPEQSASEPQSISEQLDAHYSAGGLTPSNPPDFRSQDDETTQNVENALTEAFIGKKNDEQTDGENSAEDQEEAEDGSRDRRDDNSDLDNYMRPTSTSEAAVDASSQELFRFLRGLAGELSYFGSNTFIVTLLVIFMLCETAKIPQKLVAALGKRRFTNSHIDSVIADIRNYMVIKTLMSAIVGVGVIVLCVVSRVEYPLLWGFVAFLLNYIPNIGSVAASIPPIVLATVSHGLVVGVVDAAALVALNCIVGYAVEPRLLGDGLDLSPLIVLISLIFFGWILGPIGMFLAPPLAVITKIVFQAFPETRWIAALMANRPPKGIVEDDPEDSAVEA